MSPQSPAPRDARLEWTSPDVARIPIAAAEDQQQFEPVVWGLTGDERDRVVRALTRGDDPQRTPEGPWAAVVLRPNGELAATSSAALPGGLCWTLDITERGERELIIGHDVGAVVRARSTRTELDGEWLRARLSGFLRSEATTPYRGVHHVPFGVTAVWRAGQTQPRIKRWFGPEAMPEPTVRGPKAASTYLAAFDELIDGLVDPARPIAATLSGGLDSSFVVASLARLATPDNPVHCYTHSPHPAAGLEPAGNWDPDDYEYASAMQRAYPDTVVVHRVVNEELRDPLDFVVEASLAAWLPNFNINGMWMQAMANDAAGRGASILFHGVNGNAAFSYDHSYAAGYYLRRGELRSATQLLAPDARAGRTFTENAKSLTVPVVSEIRRRRGQGSMGSYLEAVGLGWLATDAPATFSSVAPGGRRGYLEWLTRAVSRPIGESPLAWATTPVDPFATRRISELAASIEPIEWRTGPLPRAFARRLGAGRVPDEIRLRTRRGSQSADLWFATRGNRQRYLDEIDSLPATPHLGGWVDHEALHRSLAEWPWGGLVGPSGWAVSGLHHVLGLAAFIRTSEERLLASG